MASKHLRRGLSVLILSGKDKGKQGKIEQILRPTNQVVVAGINLAKKHLKKSSKYPAGGIIDLALPLHQSKVKVLTDESAIVLKSAKKKE